MRFFCATILTVCIKTNLLDFVVQSLTKKHQFPDFVLIWNFVHDFYQTPHTSYKIAIQLSKFETLVPYLWSLFLIFFFFLGHFFLCQTNKTTSKNTKHQLFVVKTITLEWEHLLRGQQVPQIISQEVMLFLGWSPLVLFAFLICVSCHLQKNKKTKQNTSLFGIPVLVFCSLFFTTRVLFCETNKQKKQTKNHQLSVKSDTWLFIFFSFKSNQTIGFFCSPTSKGKQTNKRSSNPMQKKENSESKSKLRLIYVSDRRNGCICCSWRD